MMNGCEPLCVTHIGKAPAFKTPQYLPPLHPEKVSSAEDNCR